MSTFYYYYYLLLLLYCFGMGAACQCHPPERHLIVVGQKEGNYLGWLKGKFVGFSWTLGKLFELRSIVEFFHTIAMIEIPRTWRTLHKYLYYQRMWVEFYVQLCLLYTFEFYVFHKICFTFIGEISERIVVCSFTLLAKEIKHVFRTYVNWNLFYLDLFWFHILRVASSFFFKVSKSCS